MNKSRSIFEPRVEVRPYEYPEMMGYVDAINESYWTHKEWDFKSDVQDYKYKITQKEREIVKRSILAIAQIEVSVKNFWGQIGDIFPKPEISSVGATFAESEVRHERSYSQLLEVLGLEKEFKKVLDVPEIQGRVNYLKKYLSGASSNNREKYTLTLTLFSLFIENVSLFSQFLIIKTFNKRSKLFRDLDNVILATTKEENLHAMFGAHIVKLIRKECPEWFDEAFNSKIKRACKKAYQAESGIIDWIFENGEVEGVSKKVVDNYIKYRFNISMEMLDIEKVFEVDEELLSEVEWFTVEENATIHIDFFDKKNPNYTKNNKSFKAHNLF